MKWYIRVHNAVVEEVILPFINEAGEEVPIEQRFTPEFLESVFKVEGEDEPQQGWIWDGTSVSPAPVIVFVPSKEDIRQLRRSAYIAESDCLKMEADFEAAFNKLPVNYSEWIKKVLEVKSRYPFD